MGYITYSCWILCIQATIADHAPKRIQGLLLKGLQSDRMQEAGITR